jgi:hypothetical protein
MFSVRASFEMTRHVICRPAQCPNRLTGPNVGAT